MVTYHHASQVLHHTYHNGYHIPTSESVSLWYFVSRVKLDYHGWLKLARDRIEALKTQRAAVDAELAALEQSVQAFENLIDAKRTRIDSGLTDAIRTILSAHGNDPLPAPRIRDELLHRGFPLDQKNPMAAIHQILARLVKRGEAKAIPSADGKTRFCGAPHRLDGQR